MTFPFFKPTLHGGNNFKLITHRTNMDPLLRKQNALIQIYKSYWNITNISLLCCSTLLSALRKTLILTLFKVTLTFSTAWKVSRQSHSMSSHAIMDMTHLRIWQKFAKLLQYIRYDNPEKFSLISCMD